MITHTMALLILMHATHYGPGTGKSPIGIPYTARQVASRDFPLGTVLDITYHEKRRHKVHHLKHVIVGDVCGIPGRLDFATSLPSRSGDFFGPRGWREQPRGGFPIEVKVIHGPKRHRR